MASSEEPSRKRHTTELSIQFKLCLLCQEDKFINIKSKSYQLESLCQPESKSHQHLLDCINTRAKYGNPEYVRLRQQLSVIPDDELKTKHAVWHRSCYAKATHKQHIERDKSRHDRAVSSKESCVLSYSKTGGRPTTPQLSEMEDQSGSTGTLTRSRYSFFCKDYCFYCQGEKFDAGKKENLVECRSSDVGQTIKRIVEASGNEQWSVNLGNVISAGDFLSRDIKYHKSCQTSNWRKYIQAKERASSKETSMPKESTVEFIAADIEFIAELQDMLDQGNVLLLSEIISRYSDMMRDHGLPNKHITRAMLLDKIEKQISNCTITEARGKTSVIHSKITGRSAIDSAMVESDVKGDMTAIFRCSKMIRQSILQARKSEPWTFKGSLTNCDEQCLPTELVTMIRWIIQGAQAATTETRANELKNTSRIISYSIVQACKTTRQMSLTPKSSTTEFRTQFESPYSVGLSLYMYHNFRSEKAVSMLNDARVGVTIERVQKIKNSIASSVCENMKEHGVYVPPGLLKDKPIQASMDNIDKKIDTPDGKHSFHGMAIGVYQSPGHGEAIVQHQEQSYNQPVSETLKNVPQTVIQLEPFTIEGSPKPQTSPHYPAYRIGAYDELYNVSQCDDIAWMMARYCNRRNPSTYINMTKCDIDSETSDLSDFTTLRSDEYDEIITEAQQSVDSKELGKQHVQVWSAYNSLTHTPVDHEELPNIDNTFSLPIINANATEWPTLVTALDQLTKLNTIVSGSNSKLVVTLDMDLYKRVAKLEYLHPQFRNKWVFSPGAFHTVICALRCLGRTIEGSGIDTAWQEADLYGGVTVSQIINGNHYNRAMEAHQITLQALFDLWFEAFLQANPVVWDTLKTSVKQLTEACQTKTGVAKAHDTFRMEIESLKIEQQLQEFDVSHKTDPMHNWARMYMRQVMTLLQFQRAIREGNWLLYLAALEHLCKYFFVYSRLDYAQNIPEFIARMDAIKMSDPEIWQSLSSGEFAVNTSNTVPFTRIGVDQAMEHLNKRERWDFWNSYIASHTTKVLSHGSGTCTPS